MSDRINAQLKAAEDRLDGLVRAAEEKDLSDDDMNSLEATTAEVKKLRKMKALLTSALRDEDGTGDDEVDEDEDMASDDPACDEEETKSKRKRGNKVPAPSRSMRSLPGRFRDYDTVTEYANKRGYRFEEGITRTYEQRSLNGTLVGEVSQECTRESVGFSPPGNGFLVPCDFATLDRNNPNNARRHMERRDLSTSTGVGGVNLIVDSSWIEFLFPFLCVDKLGVSFKSNLDSQFQMPRKSSPSTVFSAGELSTVNSSNPQLNFIRFTPHAMSGIVPVTQQFMATASFDALTFVREDLMQQIAEKIESQLFVGDPSVNASDCTGLFFDANANQFLATSANNFVLQYEDYLNMVKEVEAASVPLIRPGWVSSAQVKYIAKATAKTMSNATSTVPIPVMNDDNEIVGYPAYNTANIPVNFTAPSGQGSHTFSGIIFGSWEQAVIGQFGSKSVCVTVDPYTLLSTNEVRIGATTLIDIQYRQDLAFTTCSNFAIA
jgi:Phage capsid family